MVAVTGRRSGGPTVYRAWLFGVLFAARTAVAFQFQSVPAIGPYLVEAQGITFGTLGLLIGSYMLPGVLLAIPSGMLDKRLGSGRALALGLSAMVLGGLVMLGGTPTLLFAGRILSGAGAVVLNVVLAKVVADHFADRLAAAMGGLVASWPLGIALALVSLPRLAEGVGPTGALLVSLLPAVICLPAVSSLLPGRGEHGSNGAGSRLIGRHATQLAVVAGLSWGLYNVSYVVIVASLPELLALRGYSLPAAAGLTSVLGWVLIVTLPGGGLLAGRLRHPLTAATICLLLVGVAAGLLVVEAGYFWWLGMLALLIGLPAGTIMALPAQQLPPEDRSIGMGLFFTVFYGCMAILPGVAGAARAITGNPGSGLLCGGGGAILAAASLTLCAKLRRD